MLRTNGRKKVVVLSALCALIAAGGAYAYWTAGGSGSGSATAGSTANLTVNQTTVLGPMYPGDAAQVISGTFGNTNAGPIQIATVTASISAVTKAAGAPAGDCDATDFTLANPVMTVLPAIPTGTLQGAWTGASLKFNNKTGTNQDGCKGATVTLSYVIA